MTMNEERGALVAVRGWRALFGAPAVVVILASCATGGAEQASMTTKASIDSTESPATTPATTVTTEPPPPTTDPNSEFVQSCVDFTLLSAYIGNEESRARWDGAGQNELQLRADCQTIAEAEPDTAVVLERQIADLNAFFAAAEAEEDRHESERAAAQAEEERRVAAFYEAVAEAEEQQEIDNYFAAVAASKAAEEAEANRQGEALVDSLCGSAGGWYRYEVSPVQVWLDRCNPQVSTGGGGGGGDLDCDDFGYEFEIDPNDDPHGLDGDGDGIACEGW